ncbi:MAG TPA: phosphatase PAP2 family protein [Gammaproteobacteria bacterium]|nr:phosphatase PAP2 family protein [Gammaproteobacteria bacterium]
MLAATIACSPALAQQDGDDEGEGRAATVASDVKDYVTAPLHARRPQWVRFGLGLGAIALAYRYDDDVREHFGTSIAPAGVSPDTNSGGDAALGALALGGTWLAAVLGDEGEGRREAGAMLEAAALSSAAAYALKEIAGRERPYATADRSGFRSDGDAFPSLHTTAAFAIGSVLAESGDDRRRWLRRVLGYGLATATAYKRLDHDAHWLSDTVAGAALGVATARFVMKRRESDGARARWQVLPQADGLTVAYTVDLRP